MSTLRVNNIKGRSGSANALTVADSTNLNVTGGIVVTGVSTFSGSIGFGAHQNLNTTVGLSTLNNVLVGGGLTITQGVSINGEPLVVGSDTVSFTGAGVTIAGISTFHGGAHFDGGGLIKEKINIVASKLSAGANIDIENGMAHYYSTNETTTATPNLRFSSDTTLTSKMAVGETIAVSLMFKPNGAGYYAQLTIDGGAVTEEWNGGTAPASASAGGYDLYSYQITKIGTSGTPANDFIVLATATNFA